MEVHFDPETEKKLNDLAAKSGRGTAGALVMCETLESRYDDLKSGNVRPVSRDEVVAHFREKSAAARRN